MRCVVLACFFAAALLPAFAQVEVLYVIARQPEGSQPYSLTTYNVDPVTAVAVEVGSPIAIPSNNVDPLTVGNLHVLYVWNGKKVWLYPTDSRGLPASSPAQFLAFQFHGFDAAGFVADPKGKFAYAPVSWTDDEMNFHTVFSLFTIDPSTGKLTNTNTIAGRYGPDEWVIWLGGFTFGATGEKLYMEEDSNPPFSASIAEDYYHVNPQTGDLGKMNELVRIPGNYYVSSAFAFTDLLTGIADNCCGPGFGTVTVATNVPQQTIVCGQSILDVCEDEVGGMNLDPTSQNVFLWDDNRKQIFVGHIDLQTSEIVGTSSSIPFCPPFASGPPGNCAYGALSFSPDSRLIYSFGWPYDAINIYAFRPSTGDLTTYTSLHVSGISTIAVTKLHNAPN
jgi:hypothetical protein